MSLQFAEVCAPKHESMTIMEHKAGFVNIVGNPNVGKSTLMNDLVGERVSIITSKAQTTRHRITGIVNTPEYQIVFSDTPGVLKPNYKLQESMLNFSEGALTDADILLYVTDVVEDPVKNADFLARVAKETIPVLLVINKIDLLKNNTDLEAIVSRWKELLPNAEVFPISAKEGFNTSNLMHRIVELLPVSPPISARMPSPTSLRAFSSPRLSARKFCSTTTRKCPTRLRSS